MKISEKIRDFINVRMLRIRNNTIAMHVNRTSNSTGFAKNNFIDVAKILPKISKGCSLQLLEPGVKISSTPLITLKNIAYYHMILILKFLTLN